MDTNDIDLEYEPDLYPPLSELMIALQDEGKKKFNKKGDQLQLLDYNALRKFSKNIHNLLAQRKTNGLESNITRGTDKIISIINTLRKKTDTSSLHVSLRKYCKSKDNMMLVVENNEDHGGYPLILNQISEYLKSNIISSKASRTPNDAVRVTGILLHAHYRSAVTAIMANKKDRAACDLPVDPTIAFCKQAVRDFNDPTFIIIGPPDAHELDGEWDPNDADRIKLKRSGKWFWETWRDYIRKRYRESLGRFSQVTGGGGGGPSNFQNFCNGDKWVAWVYSLDKHRILLNNASTAVPLAVSNEPGCENDDDDDNIKQSASKRKNNDDRELQKQESSQRLQAISDMATNMFKTATKYIEQSSSKRQKDYVLSPRSKAQQEIVALNERQALVLNDPCYSPNTKERVTSDCGMKKRALARIMTGEHDIVTQVTRGLPLNNSSPAAGRDDVDDVQMHQT
jgi:hypothetical protein